MASLRLELANDAEHLCETGDLQETKSVDEDVGRADSIYSPHPNSINLPTYLIATPINDSCARSTKFKF
ncbi:hypothetical protein DQQ10_09870 [Pseudochryseolinea flava]|uniref:Uncharacterized protein n=1 Tax=Pseudochryseolinea flava TaxID=2059302 RepID=A0A364Y3B6_9BACT|nr:hypothetical protein DQQ10_09870 [Pseudochryseolinea flava]